MFHFCVTAEALPLLLQNSIDATIWSEILQYGLTYTMQTWSHIYDAIRCEPSDVSGYLIRTSGCLIWHDLTTLVFSSCLLVGNLKTSFIQHHEKIGSCSAPLCFGIIAVAYLVSKFKSLKLEAFI